jgi:hypothetical protein
VANLLEAITGYGFNESGAAESVRDHAGALASARVERSRHGSVFERVRDKSFLGARYIRVVDHGGGGWNPDRISLTVDGEDILKDVPMSKRTGYQGTGVQASGIQNFNRKNWRTRSYWEAELAQIRGAKGSD